MDIDWFFLTMIVLIISLCARSALCCYFRYKYEKDDNQDKEKDQE